MSCICTVRSSRHKVTNVYITMMFLGFLALEDIPWKYVFQLGSFLLLSDMLRILLIFIFKEVNYFYDTSNCHEFW